MGDYGPPSRTLASNLALTCFIYIRFLHILFEEKVMSAAKRVQLENHGSKDHNPLQTVSFQCMFPHLPPGLQAPKARPEEVGDALETGSAVLPACSHAQPVPSVPCTPPVK